MRTFETGDRVRVAKNAQFWADETFRKMIGAVGRVCALFEDHDHSGEGPLYLVEFPDRPVRPEQGDEEYPMPQNAFGENVYCEAGFVYATTNLWYAGELAAGDDDDNEVDDGE